MFMELIKNKKKYFVICLFNLLLFMPFLVYGGQNFSIDSYGIALDQNEHIYAFAGSYRWFGAVIYKVYITLTGHNPILSSTMDIIIFIILAAVFVSGLTYCIVDLLGKKEPLTYFAVNLSVLISIANVWFCNILAFPECIFITAIGLCMCFGAIIAYIKLNGWVRYFVSGLLLICSTGVYQQFISVFAIYIITICGIELFAENKTELKQIILHYIKPASLITLSGGVYFVVGKVFQTALEVKPNSRVNLNISGIVDNLLYFIKNQHSYLKGRGFFESEILTFCFLIIGLIWFLCVVKEWSEKQNTMRLFFSVASYAVAYAAAYLPGILSTSHAARAMYALFSVFFLFSTAIVFFSEKQTVKILISVILSLAFTVNIFVSFKMEMSQKEQNKVDRIWSEAVIEEINKYEKENNTEIESIEICFDQDSDLSLEKSESAVGYTYSVRSMINYYSGRRFTVNEISEHKQKELFDNKEWDTFVFEEQLFFDGDILYLCCY